MREHNVARRGAGGSARCHVFGAGRERGYPRVAASSAETRTEKLRLMSTVRQCPLCFQKRTLDCSRGMSAMCRFCCKSRRCEERGNCLDVLNPSTAPASFGGGGL